MLLECEGEGGGGGVHEVSDTNWGGIFRYGICEKNLYFHSSVGTDFSGMCTREIFADVSLCRSFRVCISTMHTRGALVMKMGLHVSPGHNCAVDWTLLSSPI